MKKVQTVLFLFLLLSGILCHAQNTAPPPPVQVNGNDSAQETMPEFPAAFGSFQKYLHDSIRYPFAEKDMGREGTIYISFVIEKDGSISSVKAVKEVPGCPGFTKEGIRVISGMPNWKPGTKSGKAVRVEITQPIHFVLGEKVKKKKKKH